LNTASRKRGDRLDATDDSERIERQGFSHHELPAGKGGEEATNEASKTQNAEESNELKHRSAGKGSAESEGEQTMATKRTKKSSKKVKTLRAKSLSAKQAKGVRGGGPTAASKLSGIHIKYDWKY
jgi:hypothetical protein